MLGCTGAELSLTGCMSDVLPSQLHGIGSSMDRAVCQGAGPLAPCTSADLFLTWSLLLVQQCRQGAQQQQLHQPPVPSIKVVLRLRSVAVQVGPWHFADILLHFCCLLCSPDRMPRLAPEASSCC